MIMKTMNSRLFMILMLWSTIASCGGGVGVGGRFVGAHCRTDADCDRRCVLDEKFPDGLCTISCADDTQCPVGTACIEKEGGICAVLCTAVRTCSDFGPRYVCRGHDRRGSLLQADVCRAP